MNEALERRRFLAQIAALAGVGAIAPASAAPRERGWRQWVMRHAEPAKESQAIREAVPVGNGRLGALIGGDPGRDFLYLADGTMWQGGRNDRLQADGQFSYDVGSGDVLGFGSSTMLAKLYVEMPGHELAQVSSYERELDLSNGLVRVGYRKAGVQHRREVFASRPDQALVWSFTQQGGGVLAGSVVLEGTHGESTDGDSAVIAFEGRLANGRRHACVAAARAEGGTVLVREGRLHFSGCKALLLVVCAGTDYLPDASRDFRDASLDPLAAARQRAMALVAKPVRLLRRTHVADHRALFDTMQVDLGASTAEQRSLHFWPRLKARAEPGSPPDPELEALYLQYGRYLTIAGSRDHLPTHLQGLWLADNTPPWSGDYHSDVNLQMNYWLPDRAGLGGCFDALTNYCLAQVGSWTEITQRLFNDPRNGFRNRSGEVAGWTVAISTNPFGGNGWWWHPAGSAWLCNSLWQHVQYTQDRAQAERLLPLLRGACEFWQARLLVKTAPDANGALREQLVADADWSPEHGPTDAIGITYAQELVWDLFEHYREACAWLAPKADAAHAAVIASMQSRLYLPRVSATRGALEEWMTPDELGEPQHRHLSPLVGLFPGDRITADRSPKALLDGCAQLLRERGMQAMGWACAWRALCWARLQDGETAYRLILENLRPSIRNSNGTAPNGFDIYSFGDEQGVFQIDANFGTPTAMLELLLYSRPGLIELLPALPAAWAKRGRVTGLGARGGFVVDLAWAAGMPTSVRVRSAGGRRTVLRAGGGERFIELAPGRSLDVPLPLPRS